MTRLLGRLFSRLRLSAATASILFFVDAVWHGLSGDYSTAGWLVVGSLVFYVLTVLGDILAPSNTA
jgi:hypothetical protein